MTSTELTLDEQPDVATRRRKTRPAYAEDLTSALAVGTHLVIGQYRIGLESGRWWWSPELYRMHGYEPADVEPGPDMLRAHQHPDDKDRVLHEVLAALRARRPFACGHRIVDARGRTRTLLVTGQARQSQAGELQEVAGYVVEATPLQKEALERHAKRSVDTAFVTVAVIEQAKGVLMAARGIDAADAESALVDTAGAAGTGLRETAAQLMDAANDAGGLGPSAARWVDTTLAGVRPSERPRAHDPQLARRHPR
jgi:hypothetical protein